MEMLLLMLILLLLLKTKMMSTPAQIAQIGWGGWDGKEAQAKSVETECVRAYFVLWVGGADEEGGICNCTGLRNVCFNFQRNAQLTM